MHRRDFVLSLLAAGPAAGRLRLKPRPDPSLQRRSSGRAATSVASRHRDNLRINGDRLNFSENSPALTDVRVQRLIAQAADGLGLSHRALPSGAGHDAQDLARIAPVGMIFIPSVGGISHSPREFSRPLDITNGANVLLRTVLAIDAGGLEG
ncbi:MAG: M20/M25/M40 family metallo-hydrolase [Gemmatimonadales bacterium]|nr:M20/M25/M40 family metallo-hydrolase [Gemmatimonadales bacterium]